MELPIVNHPDYVAKINDDNKFPIKKFGELANHLKETNIVKKFFIPKPCSFETLSQAHSKDYINKIQNKTLDHLILCDQFLKLLHSEEGQYMRETFNLAIFLACFYQDLIIQCSCVLVDADQY